MDPEKAFRELEESICWANAPPAPTPGMCYIEPQIKRDFTSFDGSLEKIVPRRLHTDLLEALDIDFVEMVMDYIEREASSTGKPGHRLGASSGLERRGEALERERIKKSMSKIFDYQKYIQESFEDVNTIVHPTDENIKAEEVYSLFPSTEDESVIIQSDGIDFQKDSFTILEEGSSQLFKKACMSDGRVFTCSPQKIDNLLVLCIRDGNAYYSEASTLYRLQEPRNQKKKMEDREEG
ncbi:uncharacterized protein Eint_070610 [Encephalitozoon intestinalis ATCC 50506]|uniref:Uncharacterized protein n=1 Tax=Encephalitozoon intestinalis (strain ATCC 50506) TaxID=876142 RepID=E0S7Z0_ENCIT|nr:uncharacterized protein Eint_070610 [Encephalitozoon intestinalis ATCC 50506]ADM11825.1 hypothetical protein Eint_070610 [Encephalitozoon intestinalis ATCC 50506]UTX45575.1 hypothetical protein GPK93_07g11380 [Encephalitozoon intestinalis]